MIQETNEEKPINDGMSQVGHVIKRMFDVIASFSAIIILSPVIAIIAILIAREKTGPVLFKQERIGKSGKPFLILKFRTMPTDYESNGPQLSAHLGQGIGPLERLLRDHHLDELPQLWNILKGEMSFVGPRPEREFYIKEIMKHNLDYEYIFMMRPGLTSWATIYNGYTDTMEKMLIRLQMDLAYFQKRSLWMDTKILFTTAKLIINGKKI